MALFAFEGFILDTDDRRLKADGQPVELNARYFDALALMAREQGRLVSKERFLSEVWDGVPVTDEALTQCIKTLRRQLGDEAGRPRFIETVPKHGYRFIAPVKLLEAPKAQRIAHQDRWRQFLATGLAGTSGGAMAGLIECVRDGRLRRGSRVLFVHTGGLPAIFGYATRLQDEVIR